MKKQIKINEIIGKTVVGFALGDNVLIAFTDGTFVALRTTGDDGFYEAYRYEPMKPAHRFDALEAGVITQDEYDKASDAYESAARERERVKDLADLKRLAEKYGLPDPTSAAQPTANGGK